MFFLKPALAAVLLAFFLVQAPPGSGRLVVEEAKLSIHVDPEKEAIFGKALLTLRNRTGSRLSTVELKIPEPHGSRAKVNVVWDRNDDLPWRKMYVERAPAEFRVQVPLTHPLGKGDRGVVGVSFEIHFGQAGQSATHVQIGSVALEAAGWFPVPADERGTPEEVRLSIRLPNEWEITQPSKPKRKHKGYALTEYEVKYKAGPSDRIVFAARSPDADRISSTLEPSGRRP